VRPISDFRLSRNNFIGFGYKCWLVAFVREDYYKGWDDRRKFFGFKYGIILLIKL